MGLSRRRSTLLLETVYTASHTLVLADGEGVVGMNVAGANNVTAPLNATDSLPIGFISEVFQRGAGQTSLVLESGASWATGITKTKLAGQGSSASLRKSGTNEWVAAGDLVA